MSEPKRSEGVEPIVRTSGRAESILCGECFDGGEFKSLGISVARCFCCGAMCGAIFASEKRQAYHVNGDRSRVRPERRHLLKEHLCAESIFNDVSAVSLGDRDDPHGLFELIEFSEEELKK